MEDIRYHEQKSCLHTVHTHLILLLLTFDATFCHYVLTLQVRENWGKRMQATMSSHISQQVETCIEIALRCVEVDREKRPTIAEIVDELNQVDTAEGSLTGQVTKNQNSNSEHRGRIVFSTTCRHPEQFDIFSCSFSPSSSDEELHLTDGVSYNYNGRSIPPAALKTLLKSPKLAEEDGTSDADVDAGHVSGLIFMSERDDGHETLYIALRFSISSRVKVFSLADIFGTAGFSGTRLEDSGCIVDGYNVESRTVNPSLIYVSTKEAVQEYRSPWTVVYKTNLLTGKTRRLTPEGVSDLSPALSPSGKLLAVASFESKSWNSENLKTDIYVMNMDSEEGLGRKLLIENGGWPSWGSDNILFFHRGTSSFIQWRNMVQTTWGVFRYNISTKETLRVTSEMSNAVTPAAISETKVAVATIRRPLVGSAPMMAQYRHIEIFDMNGLPPVQITQTMRPESDHYNPFVLDGGGRIGYHRCRSGSDLVQRVDHVPRNLHRLESPVKDVGLFRVSGAFPAISKDGSKLAFIDKEFKAVWIADSQGLRMVYETREPDSIFSPVWNQNPDKDILYVCISTSTSTYLNARKSLEIYAISNASGVAVQRQVQRLTYGGFNNVFPSSSPDGNKFVFQSTRDFVAEKDNSLQQQQQQQRRRRPFGGESASRPMRNIREEQEHKNLFVDKEHKNLYIMLKTDDKGSEEGWVTRLTKGSWTDTHCQWSPRGDWVAFSSTRDKPGENSMAPGSFSVYLVKAYDPTVVIKLINELDGYCGHVDYPVFSPDGRSIAVTMDLAAVPVDRNSLPMSMHGARPYGVIFVVNINPDDNKMRSKDVKCFRRITHSRYECSALAWTSVPADPEAWCSIMLLLAEMEGHHDGRDGRQKATSSSLGGLSDLSLRHNLQL
ncbi:hypothetical protein VPH35_108393 [Triticum aestivum]|uniref:uncharacterized protein isoform X2 n=1 Tax=Triticum aestivum TaxID=4565 RepID=UPI000845494E|nr:uncharacterized protein LOC123135605 isoform X2 [Triticum aestivum]